MTQDWAVFIGRFQPFHHGHLHVLQQAAKQAERVLVVLGSAGKSPDIKNPWSPKERMDMVHLGVGPELMTRLAFAHVRDHLYSDALWLAEVQARVAERVGGARPLLVGTYKDRSSYYLKAFPQWKAFVADTLHVPMDATTIRDMLFAGKAGWREHVPAPVAAYLDDWCKTDEYTRLAAEWQHVLDYKWSWRPAPFPPTHVTCDAVVVKSGHVLVVKRGGHPGLGQYALPGGFLQQGETLLDGALRELGEETQIVAQVAPHLAGQYTFDHPDRSMRGRTITHAFFFDLGMGELPGIEAADDAAAAQWMPLNEVWQREAEFFEDHLHIIEHFVLRGGK